MANPLVECVPNFSEGRDARKIAQIVEAVTSVSGVELLNVDPGWDTNRTVVTFVGPPSAVAEAAFQAIAKAAEVIDMSRQTGLHPRIGATDVFPFVPIEGLTVVDCAEIARQVGRRVGDALQIPVYLYEAAASAPERSNLADIRRGEYEGLADKLKDPRWKPDFGPAALNAKAGATVIGAREFLIAYNINLNTRDKEAAADIAFELRQRGRAARRRTGSPYYYHGELLRYRDNHYPCGNCEFVGASFAETEEHCRTTHGYALRELAKNELSDSCDVLGKKVRRAGIFKNCKAIGWHAEAFGRAQISINLTNYRATPPHLVLEKARELAAARGLIVTGSEIVGMIPYSALLEAGEFYLRKQGDSTDVPPIEILETAVQSMGLRDVQPFEVRKKVIGLPPEVAVCSPPQTAKSLLDRTVRDFVGDVARGEPTPGGGSVAALAGALGAALASMVAKIALRQIGDCGDKESVITGILQRVEVAREKLLRAVEDDAAVFNAYGDALRLPAATASEQEYRASRIQESLRQAIDVPHQTALAGLEAMQAALAIARMGPTAAAPDAAVGGEAAFVAVRGSLWNIEANLAHVTDAEFTEKMWGEYASLLERALNLRGDLERLPRNGQ